MKRLVVLPPEVEQTSGEGLYERTALQNFEHTWKGCIRCPIGAKAKHHVLYEALYDHQKGLIKADIMLIGEGPGASEDTLGRPFIGPSGKLLRQAMSEAGWWDANITPPVRGVLTNMVCCRPVDDSGSKDREPSTFEVRACSERMMQLIEIFEPKVILALGRVPQFYLEGMYRDWVRKTGCHVAHAPHPAAIKRQGGDKAPNWRQYFMTIRYAMMEAIRKR